MRIAVIADTHNRYPSRLPALLSAADEIWHLGDVCHPDTLLEFESLGKPFHVVMGNNDADPWPLELLLEREGQRFQLIHIPPRSAARGVQVVLHGHTHVPRDQMIGNVRWLNPGCVSRPSRGAPASFAWLTIDKKKSLGWKLVLL